MRHLVAIAGGSGITPIMSIVRSVLAVEAGSRVTLLYGNRTEESVIFADELARMVDGQLAGGWWSRHVIEARRGPAGCGDGAAWSGDAYFVCGPEAMMAAARVALMAGGVDAGRIREEKFSSPARRQEARVETAQPVTIRRAGVTLDVIVPAGATILDAGLAAGVPMALSCAMGGCGACAVTLTAGEVVMDEPNCLGPAERARGTILACVARPLVAVHGGGRSRERRPPAHEGPVRRDRAVAPGDPLLHPGGPPARGRQDRAQHGLVRPRTRRAPAPDPAAAGGALSCRSRRSARCSPATPPPCPTPSATCSPRSRATCPPAWSTRRPRPLWSARPPRATASTLAEARAHHRARLGLGARRQRRRSRARRRGRWLLDLWSQLRALGFTRERGFVVDDLIPFVAAADALVAHETQLLFSR